MRRVTQGTTYWITWTPQYATTAGFTDASSATTDEAYVYPKDDPTDQTDVSANVVNEGGGTYSLSVPTSSLATGYYYLFVAQSGIGALSAEASMRIPFRVV